MKRIVRYSMVRFSAGERATPAGSDQGGLLKTENEKKFFMSLPPPV
jgi:hypothetical protein